LTPTTRHGSAPVVIGSGLTGMSISATLSRAGVDHLLIGGPPGNMPRLGESLNLEGTLLLLEMFPELERYFFAKQAAVGFIGEYQLTCHFNVADRFLSRLVFRALGYKATSAFLQFDRVGFDAALWRTVCASRHCRIIDAKVAEVEYAATADTLRTIRLEDGTTLTPSYVFDATNHGRLLGEALDLKPRVLGTPQRAVYTHFHAPQGALVGTEAWEAATLIARLFEDPDGIDAVAWCIPLGSYVSVGLTTGADESRESDEALLEVIECTFRRYGVRYRDRFRRASSVMGLKYRYFVHDRAAGANWLLAGPSFCQVWWMASAGVGAGLAAAQLAPKLVRDPVRWGREYDRYMRRLLPIHATFDYFVRHPRATYKAADIHHYSDRFTLTNLVRLAASTRLRDRRSAAFVAPAISWLFSRAIHNFCDVRQIARASVSAAAGRDGQVPGATSGEEPVRALMAIIGGDAPLEEAMRVLAPDVLCHMGRFTSRGPDTWTAWVAFIRSRGVADLCAVVETIHETEAGTLTVLGHFRGTHAGTPVTGERAEAVYRVQGGRITEIWTHRTNYTLMFGWRARHDWAWLTVLVHMSLWKRFAYRVRGR
jgi:flavin-dependent dehydrogenase